MECALLARQTGPYPVLVSDTFRGIDFVFV